MKSLSLVVYNRGIFSPQNEWASSSSKHFWEKKRGERKCLAWSADSPLFIYSLRIQKISQVCCDRSPIHLLTTAALHSLKELTNLAAQNNFAEKTGLIYTLNDFHDMYVLTTRLVLFLLVSFWCEITHRQCTNTEQTWTMPQLRSDCSSLCSQVTHCSWCFASQELDRW